MSSGLFEDVFYYLSATIPLEPRNELAECLDASGATRVAALSDPSLTHFITPSLALEDFIESLPDDSPAHTVTPRWVERCCILGALQKPEFFSPDPTYLFSGVTATATDLSQSDCELMSAAISALGGQWRSALTRDITHLFALGPGSDKYEIAMHFKPTTSMRILVPHWFDDTVRLGIRDLPTQDYEWPEPRVLQHRPEGRSPQEDIDYEPPPERTMLYETASLSNDEQRTLPAPKRNVWDGKRLLLGLSLELSDNHRRALYADIRRQGGQVVELSSLTAHEELTKLDEADIFVTRYRSGLAYTKAYRLKKTIGTLAWLWYVRASGTLTRPADQLLHYPTPETSAAGFENEVVTVTNYTGKDREYIKKLIMLMGGEFTAAMAADKNTIVVAAYLHGTKTDKAASWSIPVVNHTWVEDCFVQWRRLTPARDKYIVFPPGVDFSMVLAERGIGRITWEPGEFEEMQQTVERVEGSESPRKAKRAARQAEEDEEGRQPPSKSKSKSKSKSVSPKKTKKASRQMDEDEGHPMNTGRSAGEVEAAVTMDVDTDGGRDDDMDVDEEGGRSEVGPTPKRAANQQAAAAEGSTKRRLVRRVTLRKTDDEAEERPTTPSPKRSTKTYGSPKKKRAESSAPGKKSQSTRRRAPAPDEDLEMSSSEDEDPRVKVNAKRKEKPRTAKEQPATKSKEAKIIDLVGSGSETESTDEDVRSVLGDLAPNGKGKGRARRLDSVLVPTVASVYGSPAKQGKAVMKTPTKPSPSKVTVKTAAAQGSDAPRGTSKAKKPARAPSPSESSRSSAPSEVESEPELPKTGRRKSAVATDNAEAGPSRASTSTSPSKLMRTPSKRSAATKATKALHDVIMPDVVSFQKELKKGAVRPAYEREQPELAKSVTNGRTPAKSRKRPSVGSEEAGDDDEVEEEEDEEMPQKKRRKPNELEKDKQGKKGVRKSTAELEVESQEAGPSKKSGAAASNSAKVVPGKNVRILTTQLSLSDEVIRGLSKLGVKFVTKPAECTHLLVRNVVRTEKFLCAMAVAPYVVSEKWAVMSCSNKKVLPESNYPVDDKDTERKYGFKLVDALKRAKTNAGKLFAGMTFYVTPKVPVDVKLLKNVVLANGGQVSTQTPTVRILSGHDNRFVISSAEEVSIWRPLAGQHKIYTQELILTSALRQEIDLNDPAFLLTGSS